MNRDTRWILTKRKELINIDIINVLYVDKRSAYDETVNAYRDQFTIRFDGGDVLFRTASEKEAYAVMYALVEEADTGVKIIIDIMKLAADLKESTANDL